MDNIYLKNIMRLTTKIKLKATVEQKFLLKETLKTCSEACNHISAIAFLSNTWNRIDLQKLVYYEVREAFGLVLHKWLYFAFIKLLMIIITRI